MKIDRYFEKNKLKTILAGRLGIVSGLPDKPDDRSVLLTFDDGPHPENTPRILDVLDQFEAKGIFFIVGNRIPLAPHLLREVVDRGHQLGNHSYSHWLKSPPGFRKYRADLEKCQSEIERLAGASADVFRPPLGQITPGSLLSARKLGLTYMLWSVDSGDWKLRDDDTAREQGKALAGELRACDIILMHDDNPHTPVLLETMLQELKEIKLRPHNETYAIAS